MSSPATRSALLHKRVVVLAASAQLLCLAAAPRLAGADSPPASSSSPPLPVLSPKPIPHATVLVLGSPEDRMLQRIQAELVGLGIQVIVRPSDAANPSPALEEGEAKALGATGAIRLLPARAGVEVWVLERGTGRALEHDVIADARATDPEAALALRTVELLRARLLPVEALSSNPSRPAPTPRPLSEPSAPPQPGPPLNWVGLFLEPDFAWYSGDNVCGRSSQQTGEYGCFRHDDKQYHGNPIADKNSVSSKPRWAGVRLLLSYDRVLLSHLTMGLRLGWAFRHGPEFDTGSKFLPLHAEVRATYWFGRLPFSRTGFRPFVFLSGGVAQFDSRSDVSVTEMDKCGDYHQYGELCPVFGGGAEPLQYNPQSQTTFGWHRSGRGFLGGGLGTMFAFGESGGPILSFKFLQSPSPSTTVLSPEIGYAIGF